MRFVTLFSRILPRLWFVLVVLGFLLGASPVHARALPGGENYPAPAPVFDLGPAVPAWLLWGLLIILILGFPALGFLFSIRKMVAQRTFQLEQTNRLLAESELRFRSTFEQAAVGVTHVTPEGVFIRYNQRFCQITGYTRDELVGRSYQEITHPDDLENNRILLRRLINGEINDYHLVKRYNRKDGSTVWVNLTTALVRTEEGVPLYCISTVEDISQRKENEAALLRSEHSLAEAQRIARVGNQEYEFETGRLTWSAEVFRILGVRRDQFSGQASDFFDRIHPDDQEYVRQKLRGALDGEGDVEFEHRIIRTNGTERIVHESFMTFYKPDGTPLRRLGTMQDVTELRLAQKVIQEQNEQLQTQLEAYQAQNEELIAQRYALLEAEAEARRLNSELEQRVRERTAELSLANAALGRASRMKDEFLASMSHELRTPLTGILGLSEALQEQVYGQLNEKQLKSLQTIEKSGSHLLDLINDILDLSKIEAGKEELQMTNVNVDNICQSALGMIKQDAAKKELRVVFKKDSALQYIKADERRIKQILVNLLANAVKFTPSGGSIGLDVNPLITEHKALFTVWDTGVGIAGEDLDKLFQPFVQLDSSLTRHYEGTGLGLALVHRLAEKHGGGITVESEPGKGSRFIVCLPWEPEESLQPAENDWLVSLPGFASLPGSLFTDKKILIAEDNEVTMELIADYLLAYACQVFYAWNGQEAVRLAAAEKPDIVIIDVQMPVMNGLEAVDQIRSQVELQNTPIIALTALAMPGDKERCIAAGVNDYLSKPVRLEFLVERIRYWLEKDKQN